MFSHVMEAGAKGQGRNSGAGLYPSFTKRGIDVLLVLLILPSIMLVVALLALLIRMDGGPAFYCQYRVGRGGRVFRMWKLRSMVVDADQKLQDLLARVPEARREWDRCQKLRCDPRITRVGQFIRKTSLDELPQIWNVLTGDMSLVGPRPFLPEQRALYPGEDYYDLRPGLTGLWQIHDRNGTSFSARAVYDSRYRSEISLKTDLQILVATVAVVVRGTGY